MNNLKEKILEKIKKGEVKMKPKIYFLLKTILLIGGGFVIIGLIVYLISLINFYLRVSGVWYLPGFGFAGLRIYLMALPWLLIFISIFLIILLEALVKHFSFVWRRPIFYSLLLIILISLLGVFLLEQVLFHPRLFLESKQGRLSLMNPIYERIPSPNNVHRGIVEQVLEDGFLLLNIDDELLRVYLVKETRFRNEIKERDSVVVLGEREDDTIKAFRIRRVKDDFNFFEGQMHRFPRKRNKNPS